MGKNKNKPGAGATKKQPTKASSVQKGASGAKSNGGALRPEVSDKEDTFPTSLLLDDKPIKPQQNNHDVETLLPGYIWVVSNFFTDEECRRWMEYVEGGASAGGGGAQEGKSRLEYMSQRGNRYMAARECHRLQRNDSTMADRLFARLTTSLSSNRHFIPLPHAPVACNPNLRVYKYTKGQGFGKHIDESNVVAGIGHTRVTVLIYLSTCEGGATRFDPPNSTGSSRSIAFTPQAGAMLLHLHGDDCLLHQADAVQKGIKYVLRTDLVYPTRTTQST